jgi:hypothetical protein
MDRRIWPFHEGAMGLVTRPQAGGGSGRSFDPLAFRMDHQRGPSHAGAVDEIST